MLDRKFQSLENSPLVPEKMIFEGLGGHLGRVTSIILVEFYFHVYESLHTQFDSKWPRSF